MLALGATPVFAANVSGWYAGIYAGGAARNDAQFSYDTFGAFLDGPGVIETPVSFVNDGIDPFLFEGLSLGVREVPFADGLPGPGAAGGFLIDGLLSFGRSAVGGVVVGYGLGNGVRIEADVSTMGFQSVLFTETKATNVAVDGSIDGAGVWTWTDLLSAPDVIIPVPYALEDDGFAYRTDTQFVLVNVFHDFDTGTSITPYLGAGLGLARVSATMTDLCSCGPESFSATTYVPAAQLGGGVRIAITDPVSLDFGYRLKLAASPDLGVYEIDASIPPTSVGFGMGQSGPITVHTLQAGLTFALN